MGRARIKKVIPKHSHLPPQRLSNVQLSKESSKVAGASEKHPEYYSLKDYREGEYPSPESGKLDSRPELQDVSNHHNNTESMSKKL